MCEAQVHEPECDGVGNECDHITNNDDHALTNLQWLSAACHKAKTLQEAQRARARRHGARVRPPAIPAAFKINNPMINTGAPPPLPPPY
jgi:5-methylcytosine-specific restriction protein A